MMIAKIGTLQQLMASQCIMLQSIFEHIRNSVEILDDAYGGNRNVDEDDGGYVLLFDTEEDLYLIINSGRIDFAYHVPEWVDHIATEDGEYGAALYLITNDFGIVLIAPFTLLSNLPGIPE